MAKSLLDKVENIAGKRRKCWLPAFSSFPTMFSKCYFFGVVTSQDCVVKSYAMTKTVPNYNDSNCDRIHSSLTTVRCFDYGHVQKQPVARKEYYAGVLVHKSPGKHINRCDQGSISSSSACKECLHKYAIRYSSRGLLNKHGHTFY